MYESRQRMPSLKKALSLEAALRVPTRELFAGTYEEVEDEVAERAVELSEEMTSREDEVPHRSRKLETLEEIARPDISPPSLIVPATS